MELRIDHLLKKLREETAEILARIDQDELLIKREVNGLILANSSKELFTPQAEHHLFAKGIIYRREPYRLVSLPLIKIYNLGEKGHNLSSLIATDTKLHFLRKFDGTMIQRFQHDGKIYFTTRGMIEGTTNEIDVDDQTPLNSRSHFDYISSAREIAREKYPKLNSNDARFEHRTLILELIHPAARVITNYGDRRDLVLLAVFDHKDHCYWSYSRLTEFATELGFSVTDSLQPAGDTLQEQIESLMNSIAGSDQEGAVINLEQNHQVIYRVKIKSPDYLKLLKLMVSCTYSETVIMLEKHAKMPSWELFETELKAQGPEKVPEELLDVYREHYETHIKYLDKCKVLLEWALKRHRELCAQITTEEPRSARKKFAELVSYEEHKGLLFGAYDNRLTFTKVREYADTPIAIQNALAKINRLSE